VVSADEAIDRIEALFAALGGRAYSGEPVTQLEHALQTAVQAVAAEAAEPLVAAALLHDVGHLIADEGETPTERGIDDRHQFHGARFLDQAFGRDVGGPVRLHVDAKRWLCATRPGYREALSADSQRSLALQGGVFDTAAAAGRPARPHAGDAVRLRLWDDAAKVRGLATPSLADFRPLLERLAARRAA
jgi:phosphonate degradation associated HDIG domain protein